MPNRELCKALYEDVQEASKNGLGGVSHTQVKIFFPAATHTDSRKGVQGALDGVGSESRRHTLNQVSED